MTGTAVAMSAAALLTAWLLRVALARGFDGWLDVPNERSLHAHPVPRIGGLAMLAGVIVATAAALALGPGEEPSLTVAALWLCALALVLASALDDRRGLPVLPRLAVHAGAAGVLVATLVAQGGLPVPPAGAPAVIAGIGLALGTIWFTNLYNFMDGADGLAGSMTAVGFAGYAWMAPAGDPLAAFSAAICGAALGFLTCNWSPARVFLGDAGSIPTGFLAAGVGLAGAARGYWPLWAPLGLFLPFVVDATVTLVIRAARGRRIWQAHREHAYQRLILAGWPTWLVVSGYAAVSALATAFTVAAS